jgi:hypothetical protein
LYHPVPVESGDETCSVSSNLLCFVAKLEKCSVAVDEPRRVGERDAEVEGLDELEICMAKFENVNLGNGWTQFTGSGRGAHL